MNSDKNDQKNGFGLSFVDLLACGLGSCILLFLIFSIKSMGNTPTNSHSKNRKIGGFMVGYSSMQDSVPNLKGVMGAVRMVVISDLDQENIIELKKGINSVKEPLWYESGFPARYKDSLNIQQFVQFNVDENNLFKASFIYYANGISELTFKFPQQIQKVIPNNKKVGIKTIVIEGQGIKEGFGGKWETKDTVITHLTGISILFKSGRAGKDISKLVQFSQQ